MNTIRAFACTAMFAAFLAIGPMTGAPVTAAAPPPLPPPPADGTMGFVVDTFIQPVLQGPDACPQGTQPKLREQYLLSQTEGERARLSLKENEPELTRRWQATAFGPNGTNLCSNPEMFDRPLMRTVQASRGQGLDLDGGDIAQGCGHAEFTSPQGEGGIDNQEYRVMGCTLEWRGVDGLAGDQEVGMRQFHASGEWTQVILLRGVDSFEKDDEVEVIYGNTPDRPMLDGKGKFLPGASFTVSDKPPRHRNVLKARIENGVLTTEVKDVVLTQTWGQGGARDIRGNRTRYDFRQARLRLRFEPDGSLSGMLGGYRPLFDVFQSPAIGGAGSALTAGIDCAAQLATLRRHADGLKNPRTGQCEGVSSAMRVHAVQAFVNDVPQAASGRTAR